MSALIAEYIATKERIHCSPVHLIDLRYRYGHFSETFGGQPVRVLTADEIQKWLDSLQLSPVSVNNYHSRLTSLFSYGVKKRYLDRNPLTDIETIKVPDLAPVILPVDDLRRLLDSATPEMLPILAIASFAGVRTEECLRLDWSQVDLARGFIEIKTTQSKTARRRLIRMQPNLIAWLLPFSGKTGPIWSCADDIKARRAAFMHEKTKLTKKAGVAWPKNSSRHSFCSYHLAKFNDERLLRNDMGHTDSSLIFAVYRELVHPEEAERYFALFPPTPEKNIIPMPAA